MSVELSTCLLGHVQSHSSSESSLSSSETGEEALELSLEVAFEDLPTKESRCFLLRLDLVGAFLPALRLPLCWFVPLAGSFCAHTGHVEGINDGTVEGVGVAVV